MDWLYSVTCQKSVWAVLSGSIRRDMVRCTTHPYVAILRGRRLDELGLLLVLLRRYRMRITLWTRSLH